MSACMDLNTLAVSANVLPDSCSGYVLLTTTEYTELKSAFSTFDSTLFFQVLGGFIVIFILGFSAGAIVRKMRI